MVTHRGPFVKRVCLVSPSCQIAPEKGGNVGARHALFSRMLAFGAQFHPSSGLGCQLPDATLALQGRLLGLFDSVAEPARVSPHGRLGETSWPGNRVPAGSLIPDQDRKPLRCRSFLSLTQGRHPTLAESFALGDGSCLLTLKLSFFSQADGLPASRCIEAYCHHPGPRRVATDAFPGGAHSAGCFPFFSSRLRHRNDLAACEVRPSLPGLGFPHTGSQSQLAV